MSHIPPKAGKVEHWTCAHCDAEVEGGRVGLEHARRHLEQIRERIGERVGQEERGLRRGWMVDPSLRMGAVTRAGQGFRKLFKN